MISESTRKAVLALVEVDGGATRDEREALAYMLRSGGRVEGRVVSFKEAARRTGRSKVSVFEYVKSGRLVAVKGGGGRNIGVTLRSLEDFVSGKRKEAR